MQYRGNVLLWPKYDESKKKPGPLLLVYFMSDTFRLVILHVVCARTNRVKLDADYYIPFVIALQTTNLHFLSYVHSIRPQIF